MVPAAGKVAVIAMTPSVYLPFSVSRSTDTTSDVIDASHEERFTSVPSTTIGIVRLVPHCTEVKIQAGDFQNKPNKHVEYKRSCREVQSEKIQGMTGRLGEGWI